MPSKKKARVRERMSKTGMSYEAALHSLQKNPFIESGLVCLERSTHSGVYDEIRLGSILVENTADDGMYLIGVEGDIILYSQQPKVVQVPLAEYSGSRRTIDAALEERVYALLDADAVSGFTTQTGNPTDQIPFDNVFETLQRGLPAPMAYVMVNERDGERVRAHVPANVRVVASGLAPIGMAYATIDPRLTGALVEHPDNSDTHGRYAMYLRAGTTSRLHLCV